MASISEPPEGEDWGYGRRLRRTQYETPRKVSIFSQNAEDQDQALENLKKEAMTVASIAGTATLSLIVLFALLVLIASISEVLYIIVMMFLIISGITALIRFSLRT